MSVTVSVEIMGWVLVGDKATFSVGGVRIGTTVDVSVMGNGEWVGIGIKVGK